MTCRELTAEELLERVLAYVYEREGAGAILEMMDALEIGPWYYCRPCDRETPCWRRRCLVCGTEREEE